MLPLLRRELIRRAGLRRLRARDLGAAGNPLPEQLDLFRRQFLVLALGHLAIADHREERALLRLARHDGRAVLAALGEQVAQAHVEVRALADYVTALPGGLGAAREFCDLLLIAAGRYAELLSGPLATLDAAQRRVGDL